MSASATMNHDFAVGNEVMHHVLAASGEGEEQSFLPYSQIHRPQGSALELVQGILLSLDICAYKQS